MHKHLFSLLALQALNYPTKSVPNEHPADRVAWGHQATCSRDKTTDLHAGRALALHGNPLPTRAPGRVSAVGARGQLQPHLLQLREHQIQRGCDLCPNSALPLLCSPPQSTRSHPALVSSSHRLVYSDLPIDTHKQKETQ